MDSIIEAKPSFWAPNGCFSELRLPLCGCPQNKSPVVWGLCSPLILGNSQTRKASRPHPLTESQWPAVAGFGSMRGYSRVKWPAGLLFWATWLSS